MVTEESIRQSYSAFRIIIFLLLVGGPLSLFEIVRILSANGDWPVHPNMILFWIFLAVAVIEGVMAPILEKQMIMASVARKSAVASVIPMAQASCLFKMAVIESIYLYAVIFFIVTGSQLAFPYFYALGIMYSVLFWPTKSRFTELVRKLEAK